MSIEWKDGRGKTVVLDERRWHHILRKHPEFKDHIEWCQSAVEDAIEIREDPSPDRSPGERYIGPAIERGLFAGMKPVVATTIKPDDTRFAMTAWTTSLDEPGTLIWTPATSPSPRKGK